MSGLPVACGAIVFWLDAPRSHPREYLARLVRDDRSLTVGCAVDGAENLAWLLSACDVSSRGAVLVADGTHRPLDLVLLAEDLAANGLRVPIVVFPADPFWARTRDHSLVLRIEDDLVDSEKLAVLHAAARLAHPSNSQPRPPPRRYSGSRRREVLALAVTGLSNDQIARHLGIEETTVRYHLGRLFRQYAAGSRTELAHLARAERRHIDAAHAGRDAERPGEGADRLFGSAQRVVRGPADAPSAVWQLDAPR